MADGQETGGLGLNLEVDWTISSRITGRGVASSSMRLPRVVNGLDAYNAALVPAEAIERALLGMIGFPTGPMEPQERPPLAGDEALLVKRCFVGPAGRFPQPGVARG